MRVLRNMVKLAFLAALPILGAAAVQEGPKEEKKLHEVLVDDVLRVNTLAALKSIENEVNQYADLKNIHEQLTKLIKDKNETEISLFSVHAQLDSSLHKCAAIFASGNDKEVNDAHLKWGTIRKIGYILNPVYAKHIADSSKKVLSLTDGGLHRYPEKHSFFAATTQESENTHWWVPDDMDIENYFKDFNGNYRELVPGNYYDKDLAQNIVEGNGSLEEALLKTESTFKGTNEDPSTPTHRLSEYSTKNEISDFEVLFIIGSERHEGEKNIFVFNRVMLTHAIKKKYGDQCKGVYVLDEPHPEDLADTLDWLGKNLKGKKLYVFFSGHGNISGPQAGVLPENIDKQGGKNYFFRLKTFGEGKPKEDAIKTLYECLRNIEVITIFDTCHSGAAVTAVESEELKRYINWLALNNQRETIGFPLL